MATRCGEKVGAARYGPFAADLAHTARRAEFMASVKQLASRASRMGTAPADDGGLQQPFTTGFSAEPVAVHTFSQVRCGGDPAPWRRRAKLVSVHAHLWPPDCGRGGPTRPVPHHPAGGARIQLTPCVRSRGGAKRQGRLCSRR